MGAILGYARVSTGDQDVAGQTMRLTEAGAIKVFTDVRSGRTMERPGLAALLAYARNGDTLAVVRLDRLGRSLGELLTTVAMLKERGIALLSLEERIDTNSAAGELVFHVFGAIAHFERRLISERTKDGIAAARARGKHPGRRPLDAEQNCRGVETGAGRVIADRRSQTGRFGAFNRLSGARPRRHRTRLKFFYLRNENRCSAEGWPASIARS
jgi:DNA invertase Pin-like site-specific DNA recombinase